MLAKTETAAEPKTYSNRSNAIAGARSSLGRKTAKLGVDFDVVETTKKGRWMFVPAHPSCTHVETAPPKNGNGMTYHAPVVGDGLDIPAALRRPPETAEQKAARERMIANSNPATRKLTTPTGSKAKAALKSASAKDENGLRAGSKQAIMFEMVSRPGGATQEEICKKLGWKKCAVTLRRVCDKVGVELVRTDGEGDKPSRYTVKGTPKAKGKGK